MVVLSDGRHLYIHVHKFESNASMLRMLIFHLKSVDFFAQYIYVAGLYCNRDSDRNLQQKH